MLARWESALVGPGPPGTSPRATAPGRATVPGRAAVGGLVSVELRAGMAVGAEAHGDAVWCKWFLKAHAALWQPAVWWALSAGGVKAGFVGRHWLLFTKDNYRERNGLGGPFCVWNYS